MTRTGERVVARVQTGTAEGAFVEHSGVVVESVLDESGIALGHRLATDVWVFEDELYVADGKLLEDAGLTSADVYGKIHI
jgi:hypothetical protein